MLQTARMIADTIPESSKRNVEFKETGGETLGKYFKEDSVDLIVAGESLQYTKFEQFFEQAHKILKPNGTLAYWFYCDPIFIDYPKANEIFKYFVYEDERFFKAFFFTDVYSEKYIPLKSEKAGKFLISRDDFTLKDLRDKMSTWSVYQRWLDTEKDSKEDIIDVIIEKIKNECNLTESTSLKVQWETAFYITHNKA
ncbi:BPG_G0053480.mRNA.1.CDS.1 [Saccharomyces cerevisiae]|nr:BPG_G0053480.mRNA.1.CDS.1 [Saccharomyces cerevisiae]CAI7373425.1 BPG_G0053480.mRNA.1.CDS.1 [Saccharomyces cerevisiae]